MTTERLEYLRGEIRAERISYGELAELQSLAGSINPDDVELLEWAGVPEYAEDDMSMTDLLDALRDLIEQAETIDVITNGNLSIDTTAARAAFAAFTTGQGAMSNDATVTDWLDVSAGTPAAGDELLGSLTVNGTPMHVCAYAVVPNLDPQRVVEDDYDVAAVYNAVGGDGPWQTTRIGDRDYVLIITPYCD